MSNRSVGELNYSGTMEQIYTSHLHYDISNVKSTKMENGKKKITAEQETVIKIILDHRIFYSAFLFFFF